MKGINNMKANHPLADYPEIRRKIALRSMRILLRNACHRKPQKPSITKHRMERITRSMRFSYHL
jgi:hypothetical protein